MSLKIHTYTCVAGHTFEGWLSGEADWKAESEAGRLCCPVCSGAVAARLPSAPHVAPVGGTVRTDVNEDLAAREARERRGKLYNALKERVLATEDVGRRFPQEARAIARGLSEKSAVRGTCTRAEAEELLEEGVPVMPLPDVMIENGN